MDIFFILVAVLVLLMIIRLLKENNSPYAMLTSAAGCIVLLVISLKVSAPIFDFAKSISLVMQNDSLIAVMKCTSIALITQMTQDLCTESGQTALGGQVELAGKLAVLLCALPLFNSLLSIIAEIAK